MSEIGNLNIHCRMHGIGLGRGSSNSWDDYPSLSPMIRAALGATTTPEAYKALHFKEGSFEQIYDMRNMQFKHLCVFNIQESNTAPEQTEFEELTKVDKDASAILLRDTRSYRRIFDMSRTVIEHNRRTAIHNRRIGNTQDIDSLAGMAMAFPIEIISEEEPPRLSVQGFYPYFSTRDEASGSVFIFFHAELNRLVMVAAHNRQHALNFILKNGRRHSFDKTCAFCGKTGDLRKCKACKAVRYCSSECQKGHWKQHRAECNPV